MIHFDISWFQLNEQVTCKTEQIIECCGIWNSNEVPPMHWWISLIRCRTWEEGNSYSLLTTYTKSQQNVALYFCHPSWCDSTWANTIIIIEYSNIYIIDGNRLSWPYQTKLFKMINISWTLHGLHLAPWIVGTLSEHHRTGQQSASSLIKTPPINPPAWGKWAILWWSWQGLWYRDEREVVGRRRSKGWPSILVALPIDIISRKVSSFCDGFPIDQHL